MLRFSRNDIADLAVWHQDPCVSIFLPTHRSTKEVQQGAVRLKNLAREASEQLIAGGKRPAEARELLEPARRLIEDDWFWQHQKDGLAVFISPDFLRHYQAPRSFPELTVVARRFHLRPLLSLLSDDAAFYVLGLGQDRVGLYEVGMDGVDDVELESLPESLAQVLKGREFERQLQFHTRTPGIQGRPAVFHGHADDAATHKEAMLRFFRNVDKEVRDFLAPESPPLILAGVDYYFPLYREASRYPRLLNRGIPGSADQIRPDELHRDAWRIARPFFDQARESTMEKYRALAGSGRTANTIEEVLPAAHSGRIDTLFIDQHKHVWGTYDAARDKLTRETEATASNEDLLDLAAIQTLLSSGTVHLLDEAQMPYPGSTAAILRF